MSAHDLSSMLQKYIGWLIDIHGVDYFEDELHPCDVEPPLTEAELDAFQEQINAALRERGECTVTIRRNLA